MDLLLKILSIWLNITIYLFIPWIFFVIRNLLLVNKLKINEKYRIKKKDFNKNKLSNYFSKIFIIITVIITVYIGFGFILLIFVLLINFITLGGIAYNEAGGNSAFYDAVMDFFRFYSTYLSSYILSLFFVNLNGYFIKSIIFNNSIYKSIKNNKIKLKE